MNLVIQLFYYSYLKLKSVLLEIAVKLEGILLSLVDIQQPLIIVCSVNLLQRKSEI